MIFQHTLKQVLDGTKSQTSRIVKPGDRLVYDEDDYEHFVLDVNGRLKWRVGRTYAVQPGRGKKAVARIRILKITKEDVRDFSHEDIEREGFGNEREFLHLWHKMHPHTIIVGRYTAWKLYFELVKENQPCK